MENQEKIVQCKDCKFCKYLKYKENVLYKCIKDKSNFELDRRDLFENKKCFQGRLLKGGKK